MVMLYFEKQEYAKAAEYAKQAYELDKSYNEALSIYVAVLIYNKQADIAEQEIAAAKERGLDISSDVRIIEAYTDTKQYGRVVELLKLQVANNPQNAQAHVSLAAAYMKINDRQHAISELEAAIEIEPSFKAQGELYIQQIRAGKDPSQTAQ